MIGRGNKHQLVGRERFDDDRNIIRHSAHDGYVDLVAHDSLHQGGTIHDIERYFNLGIALVKLSKQTRNDIGSNRRIRSNAQATMVRAAQFLHGLQGFIDDSKNFLAVKVEFISGLREVRLAAYLFK